MQSPTDTPDGLEYVEIAGKVLNEVVTSFETGRGTLDDFRVMTLDENGPRFVDRIVENDDSFDRTSNIWPDTCAAFGFAIKDPGAEKIAVFYSFPLDPDGSPTSAWMLVVFDRVPDGDWKVHNVVGMIRRVGVVDDENVAWMSEKVQYDDKGLVKHFLTTREASEEAPPMVRNSLTAMSCEALQHMLAYPEYDNVTPTLAFEALMEMNNPNSDIEGLNNDNNHRVIVRDDLQSIIGNPSNGEWSRYDGEDL